MVIIAHRGDWWPLRQRQNSFSALHAALRHGWAVEFDVRTGEGGLYLHHDLSDPPYPFARYLALLDDVFSQSPTTPRLFWHPKDIGALDAIANMCRHWANVRPHVRVIDAELLDVPLTAYASKVPLLARSVEAMPNTTLPEWACGLWWDAPTPVVDCPLPPESYYVSRELHNGIMDVRAIDAMNIVGVCTDMPRLLAGRADAAHNMPADKWWGE